MIKKITNFIMIMSWVFMMYIWIYWIVYNSSSNMAMENTFMQKVYSDLNFDYDQNSFSNYWSGASDLYDSKWSSGKFPYDTIYNKVNVRYWSILTPASATITSVVTNVIVHSH